MITYALNPGKYFFGDPLFLIGSVSDYVAWQTYRLENSELHPPNTIEHWLALKQQLLSSHQGSINQITVYAAATTHALNERSEYLHGGFYPLTTGKAVETYSGYLGLIDLEQVPEYRQMIRQNKPHTINYLIWQNLFTTTITFDTGLITLGTDLGKIEINT